MVIEKNSVSPADMTSFPDADSVFLDALHVGQLFIHCVTTTRLRPSEVERRRNILAAS